MPFKDWAYNSIHWKLWLSAIVNSLLSAFPIGYYAIVLNVPITIIQDFVNASYIDHYHKQLNDYDLSALWSFVVSVYLIGSLIGALSMNQICNAFGCRNSLFVCVNLLQVVAAIFMFSSSYANAFEMLIIGRLLSGMGSGLGVGLLAIYLTECSPVKHRGLIANFENVAMNICTLFASIISLPIALGTANKWQFLVGLEIVPALIQICLTPFFPETPKFLYMRKRNRKAAIRSLVFYHGPKVDIQEVLGEFDREKDVGSTQVTPKSVLQTRHYRIPVLLGGLCNFATMSSGILALFAYSTSMLQQAGMGLRAAIYGAVVLSATNLIGSLIAVPLLDRLGRRPLLLGGLSVNIACCVVFIICSQLAAHFSAAVWFSLAAIIVYVCVYNLGPGPIGWFLGAELTPQAVRPLAVSFSIACNAVTALVIVQIYLVLERGVGSFAFLLFVIPTSIATVVLYYWLPETKNRQIDDIVKSWI